MPDSQIDLAQLFGLATQALAQNKSTLNQVDTYNGNHGDNMVQIFNLITQALAEKKDAKPAAQLKYAAKKVGINATSGSGQVYAKGLAKAAKDFKGNSIDPVMVIGLIQTLMAGGKKPSVQSNDAITSLLTGVLGGSQPQPAAKKGVDTGALLNAGLAFLAAKQGGQDNLSALSRALVSNSAMSTSPHREQSGELVVSTLLNALSNMANK